MRTLTQKQMPAQKVDYKSPTNSQQSFSRQNTDAHNLLQLQGTIGNQALQRMMQTKEVSFQQKHVPIQKKENNTGLPDVLKSGVENLSGYSMDDVKVHYNSNKPAQLKALAYTQGSDIHVAPGQERHLPHEAWHVVQQKQGRVKPTMQMKGAVINDDAGLEREADVMGDKALQMKTQELEKTIESNNLRIKNFQVNGHREKGQILQKKTSVMQRTPESGLVSQRASIQRQVSDSTAIGSNEVGAGSADQGTRAPRYRIRVVGHASPRWRRPGASTSEQRNLALSERRARAVEDALRSLFRAREHPVEFNVSSELVDLDSNTIESDWRGMKETLEEAGGARDANDPALRRVDVEVDVIEPTFETGGYTEVITLPTRTTRWSINVDILEGAAGAAGSLGQGELKNIKTGQKVRGRWIAGGGGGGIDLPIPSVAPGSWTYFETTNPVSFSSFEDTPVRLSSIAVGIGIGYGTAEFTFTNLMDESVTLSGMAFNQWGIGGSVTAGKWHFTQSIPLPPTEILEREITYQTTAGVQFGHPVLFSTGRDIMSAGEMTALAEFLALLP